MEYIIFSVIGLNAFELVNYLTTVVSNEMIKPENNSIIYQIITLITASALGWGTSIVNGRQERKKITERDRLMMDQMKGFDNKLVDLSMNFLEFKKNDEFKKRLMNTMRHKATNIIDYNVDLDPKYKHLLMKIAREFEDFAFRFYYSDMRGIEHEIIQYLRIDMDSRIASIMNMVDQLNPSSKKFVYSATKKEEPILFKKMVIDSNLNNEIEKLLFILQKNGLTPDKVIEVFEKFMGAYLKEFLLVINKWEDLDEWDENDNISEGDEINFGKNRGIFKNVKNI